MDRWTPGRDFQCVPKIIVERAMRGEPIRVSGVDAIGDWLHVADAAAGLLTALDAASGEPSVFNVAYGETVSIRRLIEIVATDIDHLEWASCEPAQADIVGHPEKRSGAWGAYDNRRLRAHGWSPRPIADALADYLRWARDQY